MISFSQAEEELADEVGVDWRWAGLGLATLAGVLAFASRGASSRLEGLPRGWWRRKPPKSQKLCYRKKTDALTAFLEANRDLVENYGGAGGEAGRASPSEFDAINAKYGLTGKRAARSIAEAVDAALQSPRAPYCLDEIDLDALNGTSPAAEFDGPGFRLPDFAEEKRLVRQQTFEFAEEAGVDLPGCCKVCWDSQPCGDACISKKRTCHKGEDEGCAGLDVSCELPGR